MEKTIQGRKHDSLPIIHDIIWQPRGRKKPLGNDNLETLRMWYMQQWNMLCLVSRSRLL